MAKIYIMTLLGIIGMTEIIFILSVVVLVFILPIVALVDIVRNRFEGNMQLIWVFIVVLLSFLGAILYFIVGRNQKTTD